MTCMLQVVSCMSEKSDFALRVLCCLCAALREVLWTSLDRQCHRKKRLATEMAKCASWNRLCVNCFVAVSTYLGRMCV